MLSRLDCTRCRFGGKSIVFRTPVLFRQGATEVGGGGGGRGGEG